MFLLHRNLAYALFTWPNLLWYWILFAFRETVVVLWWWHWRPPIACIHKLELLRLDANVLLAFLVFTPGSLIMLIGSRILYGLDLCNVSHFIFLAMSSNADLVCSIKIFISLVDIFFLPIYDRTICIYKQWSLGQDFENGLGVKAVMGWYGVAVWSGIYWILCWKVDGE